MRSKSGVYTHSTQKQAVSSCVYMLRSVCLCGNGGQDRRMREHWRCGNSRGVPSVPTTLISLSACHILLFEICLSPSRINTQKPKPHRQKRFQIHMGNITVHKIVCIHMAHIYECGDGQENRASYLLSSKFPRVEHARTCSELSRLSFGQAGTHALHLLRRHATWMKIIL